MADADPARACLLVSSGPSPRESTRVVHTDQRGAASAPRGVGNAPFGREGRHNFSPCRFRLPPFPSTRSVLFTLDQYTVLVLADHQPTPAVLALRLLGGQYDVTGAARVDGSMHSHLLQAARCLRHFVPLARRRPPFLAPASPLRQH